MTQPSIRIEVCRDGVWTVRAEGHADVTREQVLAELPRYCLQYSHRAYFDGELIGECMPNKGGH
jgi:hypothetical protein